MNRLTSATRGQIADEIADQIASGHLPAGSRMQSERQLAAILGASRPMVREALRMLAERGLIETRPGRGSFVRAPGGMATYQQLDLHYRRSGTTARQISEVRLLLETEAARRAAERADEREIEALRSALERLEASSTPLDRVRNDLAFHLTIARLSHNPLIEFMLQSVASLTVELMVRSVSDPEVVSRSDPQHRLAFDAIARHEPAAAGAAIEAHLSVAAETYGDDYDESLYTTATRALRLLGTGVGIEALLDQAMPNVARDG
jgi:GntR family transcriptional repressor for pyruvate dehydrogenase complex